ncbi:MAG: hypothetical protein HY299_06060 [Verrucomicrobia bacterium]|nr:hypothetical protein [Verrucomicrobiota bacterium]
MTINGSYSPLNVPTVSSPERDAKEIGPKLAKQTAELDQQVAERPLPEVKGSGGPSDYCGKHLDVYA